MLASAAVPPGFPAVRIDGDPYWDGGLYSNTPVEVVFDDNPRHDSVVFSVQVFPIAGPEPESLLQVLSRQKDIRSPAAPTVTFRARSTSISFATWCANWCA